MGPIQTFAEFVAFLRRRAALIAAFLVLGAVGSVIYALNQPYAYEATAVLQIEAPKVADELAATTVDASASRRLQVIQQQIMARDTVLDVIAEYGLFRDRPALTETERVVELRKLVWITPIEAAAEGALPDGALSGVLIGVRMPSARLAQAVANGLADRVIALSRAERLDRTQSTLEFLAQQEQGIAREIDALEAKIAAYKNENDLTIAGGVEFRRMELNSLHESVVELERAQLAMESELDRLRQQGQVAVVTRRIGKLEGDLAANARERALLEDRVAKLAAEIQAMPEFERQLSLYQGQLTQLYARYSEATQARSEADMAHRMELLGRSERLRVIEPATLPDYPSDPSRKMIVAKGLVLSMLLALVTAFLLELRRPVIRTAAQMERELGLRPVVSIGYFESPFEQARPSPLPRLAALGVLAAAMIVLADWFIPYF